MDPRVSSYTTEGSYFNTPFSFSFNSRSKQQHQEQEQGIDGGIGSFTSLPFDELSTQTPSRPEAHRTALSCLGRCGRNQQPIRAVCRKRRARVWRSKLTIWRAPSVQPRWDASYQAFGGLTLLLLRLCLLPLPPKLEPRS